MVTPSARAACDDRASLEAIEIVERSLPVQTANRVTQQAATERTSNTDGAADGI